MYVFLADKIDANRRSAAEALISTHEAGSEEHQRYARILEEKTGPARRDVARLSDYNNKLVYQSGYNIFASYLSDLIKDVFSTRPDALRTNDQLRFKEIMSFDTKDQIVEYMIDKRVNELSFLGIEKLSEDIASKFNFRFFESKRRSLTIKKIAEKRNVLVHNRGIVNSRYLQLSGDRFAKIGEKVFLQNGTSLLIYLLQVAIDIDSRAVIHFGLESRRVDD